MPRRNISMTPVIASNASSGDTGGAESAGKVIRDIMRKLFLEEARSWVLLLPVAIRIRHDTIDPELGFSPYQLVCGRDRPGFGLPWALPRENFEARAWFENREQEERELGDKLRKRITDQLRRINSGSRGRHARCRGRWPSGGRSSLGLSSLSLSSLARYVGHLRHGRIHVGHARRGSARRKLGHAPGL